MAKKTDKQGASHEKQIHRLKRIEGQVRGLQEMVESKRYCVDILTQIKAVRSALSSVEEQIVEAHLNHCVQRAVDSKDQAQSAEMIDEIKTLLKQARK